ncbi:MAG: hypothetical protein IJT76_01250 [Clostridia bacterium]|nr:hypothetical protein [Clostridia bacterium]
MSQIMLTQGDRIDRQVEALIAKYQILRGTTAETLARKLGLSVSTWNRKRKQGSAMTVLQILRLESALNIPRAELLDALKGVTQ